MSDLNREKDAQNSRRDFLKFLGRTSALTSVGSLPSTWLSLGWTAASAAGAGATLASCASRSFKSKARLDLLGFQPIQASARDELVVAKEFSVRTLIQQGDQLSLDPQDSLLFGANNDFISWVPLTPTSDEDVIVWVNHEALDPWLLHQRPYDQIPTKAQLSAEMQTVGGSLLHFTSGSKGWEFQKNSQFNRRLSAVTKIAFSGGANIMGSTHAVGTMANCGGGKTPNQTFLSCEENYDQFFGEVSFKDGKRIWEPGAYDYRWHRHLKYPPEHYGWVVEVHPTSGKAQKLISLGRFSHESATMAVGRDQRWVVYSGDDHEDQCLYKFISSRPGTLTDGTLYVASLEKGRWLPLTLNNPSLKDKFQTELELKIRTREAAQWAGGTPLHRPEDVEIDPVSGSVLVALTNSKSKSDVHGSLLKLTENNSDPCSLEFASETFLTGGPSGFSCPDNLAFDHRGDLWVTSDISAKWLNQGVHSKFGNNGLFYIPMSGPNSGLVFQVASAPVGAEFTGPCFGPQGDRLFLSVQHPGEGSNAKDGLRSHWPGGGDAHPRSAVIELEIPFLRKDSGSVAP